MAADIRALIRNLTTFYDFAGKHVIHVGAGGGQIIGYAKEVANVIAVDSDAAAVAHLRESVAEQGLAGLFEIVHGEFVSVSERADVVFFEFCLHEMSDAVRQLEHALQLALHVLVLDHDRGSDWAWHACETDKVDVSWHAVEQFYIERSQSFKTTQLFDTHSQLIDKISCQGQPAIERASGFEGKTGIVIPMVYRIALVTGG
jgi:predicted RNA methylase